MNQTVSEEVRLNNPPEEQEPKKVCFVCTGNTCRSPMAEAVANALATEGAKALPETVRACFSPALVAESRGIAALEGEKIAENALLALKEAGIEPTPANDYPNHTARNFGEQDAKTFDRILCMSGSHAMQLLFRFPQIADKIEVMPTPIPDPFGGDLSVYRNCLSEIVKGVKRALFPTAPQNEEPKR